MLHLLSMCEPLLPIERKPSECPFPSLSPDTQVIGLLLDAGADVDVASKTGTPLCWAAGAGLPDNIDCLLKRGAGETGPSGGEQCRFSALCGFVSALHLRACNGPLAAYNVMIHSPACARA